MPLVVVKHKAGRMLDDMLADLADALTEIVADALHTPENKGGELSPNDIEVWVQESGKHDIDTKDLEIIIWANEYPNRLANLVDRKDRIVRAMRKFLADYDRNLSGFVWVLLQPAAYGEF